MRDKIPESFADLGERRLKNIARPMRVFALGGAASGRPAIPPADPPGPAVAEHEERPVKELVRAAAGVLENVGGLVETYADRAAIKKRRAVRTSSDAARASTKRDEPAGCGG